MPQFVTFYLNQKRYAIDILLCKEIAKIQEITPVAEAPEYLLGLINLRGQILTVMDICCFIYYNQQISLSERKYLIILRTSTELKNRGIQMDFQYLIKDPLAIVVDKLGDIIDISHSEIFPPTPNLIEQEKKFISGIIQSKNNLIGILEMDKIVNQCISIPKNTLRSLI
ncbi:MAG: chemotaxis protein CheW [Planctomycetota bacterium]